MVIPYLNRKLLLKNKPFYPFKNVLILDIETKKKNINKRLNAENSETVIWGAYSYNTGKISYGKRGNSPQQLIKSHNIIVTYNGKEFDIPILMKDYGIKMYGKTHIDLLETLRKPPSRSEKEAFKKKGIKPYTGKGRSLIIGETQQSGMIDNRFPDFKLETVIPHGNKIFKNTKYAKYFEIFKGNISYDILQQKIITENQWLQIKNYLRQDLIITKNLFEFLEIYFEAGIKDLLMDDIKTLEYMHCSSGTYSYKCFCKELKVPETYGKPAESSFPGAKVLLPKRDKYGLKDGIGYCIDFNSQHPSHQRMMNLYTPISKCKHKINGKCPNPRNGEPIFRLKGIYCGCEQGPIEKILTKWYYQRLEEKKNKDPHQYTSKIKLNSSYGISSSPIFEQIYNSTTGPDTTLMSQDSMLFMALWMERHGYIVTYGDTDSLYIMDPFKDKERMLKVIKEGIEKIKEVLPFADDEYQMSIDAEFTHIFFFQDENDKAKKYKKKNYIYITKSGRVKINGLPLLKRNAPKLAKIIYLNYLEKEIKRTNDIKFDKEYIKQLIYYEIKKDLNILTVKIRVNNANLYASLNQQQAQISNHYFQGKEGIFKGIKHLRKGFGIGKGKFYCTQKEAIKLQTHEYDLQTIWKTLKPFIKEDKQTTINDY